MTKQSLTDATRRFKFFPTIAELAEFFGERRAERRPVPPSEISAARINSLARAAMRHWSPPRGLPYRGQRAWEAWALGLACDDVRAGKITGTFKRTSGGFEYDLTDTISAPVVPDVLFDEWANQPLSEWEM